VAHERWLSPLPSSRWSGFAELERVGRRFALVGGLAISVRAEVRFTRDVDLAVCVDDDADAKSLVYQLGAAGYAPIASVEHETCQRLATVRLLAPQKVKVDLLFASSGIEDEVVAGATPVDMGASGRVPVASAEELLALEVLSMTEARLQDRLDAQRLLEFVPDIDLTRVRSHLDRITERGFHREQALRAKLDALLAQVRGVA
jgi:hypothetical protein